MKRLQIDFSQPSVLRTIWRTPATVWMLAAAMLGLSVYAAFGYWKYLERLRAYEVEAEAINMHAAIAKRQVKVPGIPPVSQAQSAAVNGMIARLNLPWRTLFDAIQHSTPSGVALLSLEPDARKRTIRITAEARGSDEMIAYIEEMQQQELFSAVSLIRHEINEPDPNHPVRFQIDAQWRSRQ